MLPNSTMVNLMFTTTPSILLGYLDAGSGSMILAALAGGVAGIAVLGRLYWHRFLGVFSKSHRAKAAETAQSLSTTPTDDSEVSA